LKPSAKRNEYWKSISSRESTHERVLDNWLRYVNLADLVLARSTISKNNHRRAQLWRLRRAITIESGLFKIQAKHLLQFRQRRQAHQKRQEIIDGVYRNALATDEDMQQDDETSSSTLDPGLPSTVEPADPSDDLTRSFVRLSNLPTYPLDRLSRYEATLWRQACQVLFTLRYLDRRKPWERLRVR
jgi:hypothetical protein